MDPSQEVNTRYELLLQEIEGVDDYWGPTFRAIFQNEDYEKFMEHLVARIKHHDKEIERMCNSYYHGFIDSIRELQEVKSEAKKLNDMVLQVNKSLQESSSRLEKKCEELAEARRIESNITATISGLSICLPVFSTYSKLQKQISEKRYYPALKTLEQLEHLYLPRVSNYEFFKDMKESIPQMRENIKDESMSDLKDFLENIRRLSSKIGEVAMRHTCEQLGNDAEILAMKVKKKKRAPPPPNPFTGEVEVVNKEDESDVDGDDVSAQHLIDFSPIYRCLHIYSVLGSKDVFVTYYRTQRKKQARLVIQPSTNMHESISDYRDYLQSIVGFFVVEDHILNTTNDLIDRDYLDDVWSSSMVKMITALRTHSAYCTDANLMLKVKEAIILFCCTLRNYGFRVNQIMELLHDIKDQYNEILMQRWVQVFREILDQESFLPVQASTQEEYDDILEKFPFDDESLECAAFPKKFPFSSMVPKVYQQVKEYIYACLKFAEDLNLNQNEIDDVLRKSTNLLLTRTFSGCLSAVFRKPSVGLLQVIQIIIDTGYLENSSMYLEEFVCNITGSTVERKLAFRNQDYLFKAARDDAERQISDKVKQKLDEFLELENYDWMLVEPKGHASSFITDLIAFLRSIFESFTNLPVKVAQKTCYAACDHIAKSILAFMTSDNVKQMSMGALQQINLDTIQCEQFAASQPVSGSEDVSLLECFNPLRQLLDLLMSWDWSTYFHDYGQDNNKYQHVNPATAIIVLEKLREADKKSVFSALRKSERDKKKLLDTVLKQLRQLAITVQQSS